MSKTVQNDALCCHCCFRRIEQGGFEETGKTFCDQKHFEIWKRYSTLCKQAVTTARKHDDPEKGKIGEIDYDLARQYLSAELELIARELEPTPA